MDIKTATVTELKALVYDLSAGIQDAQNKITIITQELKARSIQAVVPQETPK